MNSTTWLHKHEQEVQARLNQEMEELGIFGHSPYTTKVKQIAVKMTQDLWRQDKLSFSEAKNILDMIHSSAADNLDFAVALLETLINPPTQTPTQDVSNISCTEPPIPESRPQ